MAIIMMTVPLMPGTGAAETPTFEDELDFYALEERMMVTATKTKKSSLDTQFHWIGDRKRSEDDTRPDIDDYALVDIAVQRKNIAKHWDIALKACNLFDKDAKEPSSSSIPDDYPMEGRSFYGEIRCHF
ncbi:TonB-dependent receptor domain-containing protein [Desulfonema magnum]|uniref:TonB-dependent receptor domain-containing protein n=2 Tax=Desulfonema magnum TaxID=45655 RepID=A0A975BKP2_9BACT|nr:TonB-dependent receptor domain-containing protein [Desulfonema magnum]